MDKTHLLFVLFLLGTLATSNAFTINDFHCKIPTCRDFYYGLKNYPRHKQYVDVCYDSMNSLQNISQQHGKCVDDKTSKINPACIYGIARTINKCMSQLNDLPIDTAKYYCGYVLLKYCATHVGIDRLHVVKTEMSNPSE